MADLADELAPRLAAVPGVVAVTLGGSRARGDAHDDSDWDFGLYYRGDVDVEAIRALGYPGEIVERGACGRLVDGGAWLTVDGARVDLLYRDVDVVARWSEAAEQGRFEVDLVEGFVAGMPTYALVGELAQARVLVGQLPRPQFPEALRAAAPPRWYGSARFSLDVAEVAGRRADVGACAGLLAKAALAAAQGRLAERAEWALNEKAILSRAGLREAEGILTAIGSRPLDLGQSVFRMRLALGIERAAA